jgi:GTP 3',8-cyclase
MLRWCANEGYDLTLIETMPLGQINSARTDQYVPLAKIKSRIEAEHKLLPLDYRSAGPARYFAPDGLGNRLGLITPMSNNFCAGCNRMRLTCEGKMFMCLGHDKAVDFREALRGGAPGAVDAALDRALANKPLAHDFFIGAGVTKPAVARHMSVTGG